ncbi:hypothetical protein [Pseudooceanicola sp.]|uniref:hypothetical protein n=1 Tax=Pseudooceanicola sp. TaxID=1914328 RepID=UPI0040585591
MSFGRSPQRSFSSGEISPLLYGRPDYQRYQTGLRSCVGYLPLLQGGITRAPGTIHRGQTEGNAAGVLVPFEFAANDTVTLEFTPLKVRVWRYGELVESGGEPYVLATPYDADAIQRLSWVQSADVIYLADGVLPIQKLSRFALDNWSIATAEIETGPFRVQNLDDTMTIRASASTGVVTLTGTGDIFSADWVGSLILLEPDGYDAIPLWTSNTDVAVNDLMRVGGHIYRLTAGTNTGATAPSHTEGVELVDKDKGTKWAHVSDGRGIVRVAAFINSNQVTATVLKELPPPVVSGPTYRWSEGAWSARRGYPKALELHKERFVAGFTSSEPRTTWYSTVGTFDQYEPSDELDASFAYAITGSRSANSGNWLVSAKRGIYIGALGEVLRGYSNAPAEGFSFKTFDTSLEATSGSSNARPIVPHGFPVFVTKEGARLQELRYSLEEDGGKPLELSLPSQHIGIHGFVELAWQSAPQPLGWIRLGNGELAAMLYDPNEDVLGWARYPLAGGKVESMAVTTDATTGFDTLTMIVQREVDGQIVRFVEEQAVTWGVVAGDTPLHKAVHYFAASVFELEEATDTFSVPHLVGEAVHAWTNQGDHGPTEVPAGGEITLPVEVTHAVIGLFDETHHWETLNVIAGAPDGDPMGRERRLHGDAGIVVHRTAAGKIQTVERDLGQPVRMSKPINVIPLKVAEDLVEAYSGTAQNPAVSGSAQEVSYRFLPFGGAPMTVLALSSPVEEEGA